MASEREKTPEERWEQLKAKFSNGDKNTIPLSLPPENPLLARISAYLESERDAFDSIPHEMQPLDTETVGLVYRKLDEKILSRFGGTEETAPSTHIETCNTGELTGLHIIREKREGQLVSINIIRITGVTERGIVIADPTDQYTIKSDGEFIHSILGRSEEGKIINPTVATNKPGDPDFNNRAVGAFQRFKNDIAPYLEAL